MIIMRRFLSFHIIVVLVLAAVFFLAVKAGNNDEKSAVKNFRVSSEISTGWSFCRNQALYASQFLYDTDEQLLWTFLQDLSEDGGETVESAQSDQENILNLVSRRSKNDGILKLLKVSLEMETSAPKFESQRQFQAQLSPPKECNNVFIEYRPGGFVCTFKELEGKELIGGNLVPNFDFDFIYSVVDEMLPFIRIYTVPGSLAFAKIFQDLKKIADEKIYSLSVQLIVSFDSKHFKCPYYENEVVPTGYGLEFEIKSSQYVIEEDAVESKILESDYFSSRNSYPQITAYGKIKPFPNLLTEATNLLKSLDDGSLDKIKEISTNLLLLSESIREESIEKSTKKLSENGSAPEIASYRINDFDMIGANLDPFRVLEFMTLFNGRVVELAELGYSDRPAILLRKLLKSRAEFLSKQECYKLSSKSISYLNDLEKDHRYLKWPREIKDQLTAPLGLNVQTVLFPIDIANQESDSILEHLLQFISAGYPFRLGIIPIINLKHKSSFIETSIKSYYFSRQEHGLRASLTFLRKIITTSPKNVHDLNRILKEIRGLKKMIPNDLIFGNEIDDVYKDLVDLNARFEFNPSEIFSNGQVLPLTPNLPQILIQQYHLLMEHFKNNKDRLPIKPPHSSFIYESLLAENGCGIRRIKSINSIQEYHGDDYFSMKEMRNLMRIENYLEIEIGDDPTDNDSHTEEKQTKDHIHSIWLAGDYSKKESFSRVIKVLDLTLKEYDTDTLLHPLRTRVFTTSAMNSIPNRIIVAATALLSESGDKGAVVDIVIKFLEIFYKNYFNGGLDDDDADFAREIQKNPISVKLLKYANDLQIPIIQEVIRENEEFFKVYTLSDWERETLFAINSKGFKLSHETTEEDTELLKTLLEREIKLRGERHFALAKALNLNVPIRKSILSFSLVERKLIYHINRDYSHFLNPSTTSNPDNDRDQDQDDAVIRIGDEKTSMFHVIAKFNPFNREGQKFASIFSYLAMTNLFSFSLSFIPTADDNANEDLRELRIYRFVTPEYRDVPIPIAPISDPDVLISLTLDLPTAWTTVQLASNADLDNIRPLKTPHLKVKFGLKHIVIEGTVSPQNVQEEIDYNKLSIQLYNRDTGLLEDETRAIGSFGYYQLKSGPGRWIHRVITSDNQVEYPITKGEKRNLFSFAGQFNDLVIKSNDPIKLQSSLQVTPNQQADINIFSLASGLFYERLLRIMIASVMAKVAAGDQTRRSKSPTRVKFWLLESTISAQGLDALKVLSQHYSFEYELMNYRWPFWLNPQNKKHRTIWAYKILFLDTLFPKHLKRIIFIDADQVIRTDNLKELTDLNLKGHVYAMTPFCSDKTEMKEFRFWEQNYWKNHLKGRPYHISALFVVDLEKLRNEGIGNVLRSQYQVLSRDPNSLANLDQDLPNFLQSHNVPILSLPQEWLWCDTWCSSASKSKAKTIDLCNNPKTFESKFDQAKRIIPEWSTYDEQIKKVLLSHSLTENGNTTINDDEGDDEEIQEHFDL